mmetsp:Transcript_8967/g.15584  ORF Transcript_8967/g.15584 Transcript_8967/m.15584 type:complete len:405 (+) Transcript_8967:45-1259(+)
MSTVAPAPNAVVSLEQKEPGDEESVGIKSSEEEHDNEVSTNNIGWGVAFGLALFAGVAILSLAVSLAIGLNRNDNNDAQATAFEDTGGKDINPNLIIYDEALAILESTPLQYKKVPSGETLSYREYNAGQPNVLVVLPGFMADDSMTSILAVMPELQDHYIIAVNPRGWNGSTMNKPIISHEENAEEVMELLKLLRIEKPLVMGLSTGGGIAFYLAQKYPDMIKAAFLVHSIPLSGLKYLTINNELVVLKSIEEIRASAILPSDDPGMIYELFKSMSTEPYHFIPKCHKLNDYFVRAAQNMPGSSDVSVANASFNVTPIRTTFALPSEALSTLKTKLVVIHGSQDFIAPWQIVEPLIKLAIAEQWAPPGKLSFYDDGLSHMGIIDSPNALARVYRQALVEQVLV